MPREARTTSDCCLLGWGALSAACSFWEGQLVVVERVSDPAEPSQDARLEVRAAAAGLDGGPAGPPADPAALPASMQVGLGWVVWVAGKDMQRVHAVALAMMMASKTG